MSNVTRHTTHVTTSHLQLAWRPVCNRLHGLLHTQLNGNKPCDDDDDDVDFYNKNYNNNKKQQHNNSNSSNNNSSSSSNSSSSNKNNAIYNNENRYKNGNHLMTSNCTTRPNPEPGKGLGFGVWGFRQ